MKVEFNDQKESIKVDFKKIQLVESIQTGNIVLTTGKETVDDFCGILISSEDKVEVQRFSETWDKSNFKIFEQKITISND
jgi:hypothetical protein